MRKATSTCFSLKDSCPCREGQKQGTDRKEGVFPIQRHTTKLPQSTVKHRLLHKFYINLHFRYLLKQKAYLHSRKHSKQNNMKAHVIIPITLVAGFVALSFVSPKTETKDTTSTKANSTCNAPSGTIHHNCAL